MQDLTNRNPYLKEEYLDFIDHQHDYFEIDKNTKLYTQTWTPKNTEPKAKVLFLHGYREHSSLYTEFLLEICKIGITVHAIDYEGHGFSTGLKGYVHDFNKFVETIVQYLKKGTSLLEVLW
jgi:acylglycerol lipase